MIEKLRELQRVIARMNQDDPCPFGAIHSALSRIIEAGEWQPMEAGAAMTEDQYEQNPCPRCGNRGHSKPDGLGWAECTACWKFFPIHAKGVRGRFNARLETDYLHDKIDRLRAALEAIKILGESRAYDMRDLDMYAAACAALRPNAEAKGRPSGRPA